jgi:hypothetical protein
MTATKEVALREFVKLAPAWADTRVIESARSSQGTAVFAETTLKELGPKAYAEQIREHLSVGRSELSALINSQEHWRAWFDAYKADDVRGKLVEIIHRIVWDVAPGSAATSATIWNSDTAKAVPSFWHMENVQRGASSTAAAATPSGDDNRSTPTWQEEIIQRREHWERNERVFALAVALTDRACARELMVRKVSLDPLIRVACAAVRLAGSVCSDTKDVVARARRHTTPPFAVVTSSEQKFFKNEENVDSALQTVLRACDGTIMRSTSFDLALGAVHALFYFPTDLLDAQFDGEWRLHHNNVSPFTGAGEYFRKRHLERTNLSNGKTQPGVSVTASSTTTTTTCTVENTTPKWDSRAFFYKSEHCNEETLRHDVPTYAEWMVSYRRWCSSVSRDHDSLFKPTAWASSVSSANNNGGYDDDIPTILESISKNTSQHVEKVAMVERTFFECVRRMCVVDASTAFRYDVVECVLACVFAVREHFTPLSSSSSYSGDTSDTTATNSNGGESEEERRRRITTPAELLQPVMYRIRSTITLSTNGTDAPPLRECSIINARFQTLIGLARNIVRQLHPVASTDVMSDDA